jgi:hypothetical protein
VVLAEVCHIKANRPGGTRYDSQQTDAERQGFENLLLMCAAHHKIIDEQSDAFTVGRLAEIKKKHESKNRHRPAVLDDNNAQTLVANINVSRSVIQTVNQSGGQAAHLIINSPSQIREPDLIPRIHAIKPHPGQLHAFCLHIENQGTGTGDQPQIRVEHNEVALPAFSPGFWRMGPSHRPYTFTSSGSINPKNEERVFQVGFQSDPEEFVFQVRISARDYIPTNYAITFSREESQNQIGKYGSKM